MNKRIYKCICNGTELDLSCAFHFSAETRVVITPEMQDLKHCHQISHQEAYEHGMRALAREAKLLNDKENYKSYKPAQKECECR